MPRAKQQGACEAETDRRALDRAALDALIHGDDRALNELVEQHSALVFGLARRVTNDETAASDITQEVFVYLWQNPDRIDLERGSIRSFLGVFTHRRAVDWVRRSTRAKDATSKLGDERPANPSGIDDYHLELDANNRANAVRVALRALPDDLRRPIELAYFGALTYRQVAIELGIPEGTAKSRMRKALSELRGHITEDLL